MNIKQYSAPSLKNWRTFFKINFICLIISLMTETFLVTHSSDSTSISLPIDFFGFITIFSFFSFLLTMKFEEISTSSYIRLEKDLAYANNQSLTNTVKEIFKNQGSLLCYFNMYSIYAEINTLPNHTSNNKVIEGKQFFVN